MKKRILKLSRRIKQELEKGLPGEGAHKKMTPDLRDLRIPGSGHIKDAAVMLTLYPDNEYIMLSFIKRAKYDGAHSGQISFPGGMKEDQDRDLFETARRETAEETGIDEKDIEFTGKLSPIYIPVSGFRVSPYISTLNYTPDFRPDIIEVEFMINIPVVHFTDSKRCRRKEKWNLHGNDMKVPFFYYENFKIWGATAMILSEFIDVIQDIEPAYWTPAYSDND